LLAAFFVGCALHALFAAKERQGPLLLVLAALAYALALLSKEVTAAASSSSVYDAYANALKNKAIWIVHGEKDESIPVDQARKMFAALKTAGNTNVVYNELPGEGHGSVVPAFTDPKLFEWLRNQTLNK